jgi:hypothetical protein
MEQYSNISDSKQKGQFLDDHPEVIKQWNAQADYTNKLREQLGYTPFKNYPEPSTKLQTFMDTYNGASTQQRKLIRNSDPNSYQNMIAYFDSLDLYNINKEGALNQLQGEPDQTSKQNKAISNLAKDIYQNPDGTYQIVPAGWMQGQENGSGSASGYKAYSRYARSSRSSGSSSGGSSSGPSIGSVYKYAVSPKAGGQARKAKVTTKAPARKVVKAVVVSKPKVTRKKSKV